MRSDPLGAVLQWEEVEAQLRGEVRNPGLCNTDGLYQPDPPRILIAASTSPRRQTFTALHELGHHLAFQHEDIADLLWGPDGDRVGEELADAFAAFVLFPDDMIEEVFTQQGPTAQQVADLFTASHASRAACCVAASNLLNVEGYVLVTDLDAAVQYAASAHMPYRLRRGVHQPDGGLITKAAALGHARGTFHVQYPAGSLSPPMAADAVRDDYYVFVVAVQGRPPWGAAWDTPGDARPIAPERHCLHCGAVWEGWAGEACDKCGQPPCLECSRCACVSDIPERRCPDCGLTTAAFVPGAAVCNDCS